MKKHFIFSSLFAAALFAACSQKQAPVEIIDLPRIATEPSIESAVSAMFAEDDTIDVVKFESVMVLKHGNVVYENWINDAAPDKPHVMWSVSKSFCATAVGMAIDEGKLALTDKVIDFFPDQLPEDVSDNLKAMTVRDLLTMNCGHETEPNIRVVAADIDSNPDWITTFLAHPVTKEPGTWYCYNSIGTFMLSAIVQKVTGQKINEYLTTRLWEPLHISVPEWQENPQGINLGGWGLHLKTEDMAKFGQMFLQKGMWNGKQLVSENWVNEASKCQVPSVPAGTRPDEVESKGLTAENCAWLLGYGYQMWRCIDNAYRADGAFGQYIYVLPNHDAVIAITASSQDLQAEVNLIYKYLFPAVEALD